MILNSTMSLVVVCDDPANSQDLLWNVSWVDLDTNYFVPGAAVGDCDGTNEVEMIPSPNSPRFRQVKSVTVTNIDDVTQTVHVMVNDGIESRTVATRELETGEEMSWGAETGWLPRTSTVQIAATPTADLIVYDPQADSNSTLDPKSVAGALDDLYRDIRSLEDLVGGGDDSNSLDGTFTLPATAITYDGGDGGDSNSTATTAQEALDELYGRVRSILATIAGLDATNIAYGSIHDSNSTATTVAEALEEIYVLLQNHSTRLTALEAKTAYDIPYDSIDGGDSNSTATSVGGALDDIYTRIRVLTDVVGGGDDSNSSDGTFAASGITYDAGDTGDSNSTMTNVQDALDDLYSRVRTVGQTIANLGAGSVAYDSATDSNSTPTTVGGALDDIYTKLIALTNLVGGGDDSNSSDFGIAHGGFTGRWTFSTGTSGDPNTGGVLVNNATQLSATAINISYFDIDGISWSGWWSTLDTLPDGAWVKLTAENNPTRWLIGRITNFTNNGTYYTLTMTDVSISAANPLQNGSNLIVSFSPTYMNAAQIAYDSGDTGDSNSTQTTVATALDDLYARLRTLDALVILYNSGDPGDSNSTAATVAAALDDIYSRLTLLTNLVGGGDDSNSSDGSLLATAILYDSGDTGDSNSAQTTVADALDDLYSRVRAVVTPNAASILYDSGDTGDSNSAQTTVAGALDDLYSRIRIVYSSGANSMLWDSPDGGDSNSTQTTVSGALTDLYGRFANFTYNAKFASVYVANVDTQITRNVAGVIAVAGGIVPKENRANTFTAAQTITNSSSSNGLTVTQTGNSVGIASITSTSGTHAIYSKANSPGYSVYGDSPGVSAYGGGIFYGSGGSKYLVAGFQTAYSAYANSDIYCAGSYLPSDFRLKDKIEKIRDPREVLLGVEWIEHDWKEGSDGYKEGPENRAFGLIAQNEKDRLPAGFIREISAPVDTMRPDVKIPEIREEPTFDPKTGEMVLGAIIQEAATVPGEDPYDYFLRRSLQQKLGTFMCADYTKFIPFIGRLQQIHDEEIAAQKIEIDELKRQVALLLEGKR